MNDDIAKQLYDRYIDDCAGWACSLTNIFKDKDTGATQTPYKEQIQFMNRKRSKDERVIVVLKSRQCKSADTFVYTENGPISIKELEEIKYRGKVWTLDDNKNSKLDQVVDVWYSGDKELYEVKLWTGEKIKLTQGDEVKTNKGWIKVEDLKVDDLVWIFDGEFGNEEVTDEEAILMGYFITDGSFSNATPKFTNINWNYIDEFERCVKKQFNVQTRRVPKGKGCDLNVVGQLHYGCKPSEYSLYLSGLGLRGLTHDKKVLPEKFLNLNKEKTALLLNRMFAGDGWYAGNRNNKSKSSNEVGIGSPSLKFVHQVNYLLNKFGIHGRIETCKFKGTPNPFYKLRFSCFEYVQKFIAEIGIYDKELRFDINPEHKLKKQKNRIKSITKLDGLHPTYDLETRDYHSFIANGIHVHNCGFTTAVKARAMFQAYFGLLPNIIIASAGEKQANRVLAEIKDHFRSMPEPLRPVFVVDNASELLLESGSRITSVPANPQTVRGNSAEVIWDEAGVFGRRESDEFWSAIFPSISKGWSITLISTPKGKENKFYDLCNPKLDEHGDPIEKGVRANRIIKVTWDKVPHIKKFVDETGIEDYSDKMFLQEYCCEFLEDSEDSLFNSDLLDKKMFDPDLELLNLNHLITITGPDIQESDIVNIKAEFDKIYIGFDPAISEAKDSDGSAIVAVGVKGDIWKIIFIKRLDKGMSQKDQCEYVSRLCQCLKADKVGFDTTGGMGLTFGERLRETSIVGKLCPITFSQNLKVQSYTEIKSKIENRKLVSGEHTELRKQLLNLGFNPVTKKIKAMGNWRKNKDDLPSALLCAHECRQKNNNSGFHIIY